MYPDLLMQSNIAFHILKAQHCNESFVYGYVINRAQLRAIIMVGREQMKLVKSPHGMNALDHKSKVIY